MSIHRMNAVRVLFIEFIIALITSTWCSKITFVHEHIGLTPLHWVMLLGKSTKILEILLNNTANVNALNVENESPLNIGIEKGNESFINSYHLNKY